MSDTQKQKSCQRLDTGSFDSNTAEPSKLDGRPNRKILKRPVCNNKPVANRLKRIRVVISGGGLFGTAVFAFLSQHEGLEVILVEAGDRVGGDSTRMNHGRLHIGITGIFTDPEEVTDRKARGNRIICAISDVLENDSPGIYGCAPDVDAVLFKIACLDRRINISDLRQPRAPMQWLNRNVADKFFSVPELAFNPARLSKRLADLGFARGGKIWLNSRVKTLRRSSGRLSVKIQNRNPILASFVVNCNSKFANSILFEDRAPLLDLEYYRWPVMSISSQVLGRKLNNVISVFDKSGKFPSMIPHGDTITFDAKTTPELVNVPSAYPLINPKKFDPRQEQEATIFEEVRRAFKPLKKLSLDEFRRHVSVFYGVHGRRKGELTESDISKPFRYPGVENYLIRHGGLATTSLLDAMETVEEVESQLGLQVSSQRDRMVGLVRDMMRLRESEVMIYEPSGLREMDASD